MMKNVQNEGSRFRLGIDIGGTFTDLCAIDSITGRRIELKTPTVPMNPAKGVANGIELLKEKGVDPGKIEYFVHGTTIALNALIQRSGAKIALLVTEGFRDVLEHARIKLPVPWDFYSHRPEPLVPRERVYTVNERTRHDGIEIELTETEINRVVSQFKDMDIDGVAICLLHSYANPTHETILKNALEKSYPHLFVSASSDIWPQIREYERSVATVINAYVRPTLSRYLNNLEKTLQDMGVNVKPYLTKSNGGIMTTEAAKKVPIETLLSGPASGVIGALGVGTTAGLKNIIGLDMGGTSADVAVIENGNVGFSREEQIGDFPLILPAIGISSIGAGGGSIAWLDGAGVLKVGPTSAGANPGPACYGLGGKNPTLTDAFLLCGYLNPSNFVGNTKLDLSAAKVAMQILADQIGLGLYETASAVIRVAIANMYAELSAVLERKGLDPRDFALMAFGGAGAVVACQLAKEVNINRVIIPQSPGTLCALGALKADVMSDFIRTVNWRLNTPPTSLIESSLKDLRNSASKWLEQEAPIVAETELIWSADMRYVGQSYEIEVTLEEGWIQSGSVTQMTQSFHAAHDRVFNHSDVTAPVEIVNLRVRSVGYMPQLPDFKNVPLKGEKEPTINSRKININGKWEEALVYQRDDLKSLQELKGALIVEQSGSTTVIPEGFNTEVDEQGNIIITRKVVSYV